MVFFEDWDAEMALSVDSHCVGISCIVADLRASIRGALIRASLRGLSDLFC
jgi:hypothetical protein